MKPIKRQANSRERFLILERDQYKCVYCGATGEGTPLHIDHVVPFAKGGETQPANLVSACQACNLGKHDRDIEQVEDLLREVEERNRAFQMENKWIISEKSKKSSRQPKKKRPKKRVYDLKTELDDVVAIFINDMNDADVALYKTLFTKGEYKEKQIKHGIYTEPERVREGGLSIEELFGTYCEFTYTFTAAEFEACTGATSWKWWDEEEAVTRVIRVMNGTYVDVVLDDFSTYFWQRPECSINSPSNALTLSVGSPYVPFYERFIHEVMKLPMPESHGQ